MELFRRFDRAMERNSPVSYGIVMLAAVASAGLVKLGWLSGPVGLAANIALFGYAALGLVRVRK